MQLGGNVRRGKFIYFNAVCAQSFLGECHIMFCLIKSAVFALYIRKFVVADSVKSMYN